MKRHLICLLALTVTSVTEAQDTTTREGAREILPRAHEIALARSAAPPSISAGARVLVLSDTGYVVGEHATANSRVTCVVNRSWRASIEPHCYDEEAAATVMPIELRRNTMRHQSRGEEEIDRAIAAGLADGTYRLPDRPAMTYMMSARQVLYDDEGRRVGPWRPHLMIYYPYLTNADVGLPAAPDMHVGMVSDEGRPSATLIIIMPAFAPTAESAAR